MERISSEVYAEVLILMNYYLRPNELEKIPKEKLEFMKNKADKKYVLDIDETKSFSEQKISKKAKAIILSLYKKYFITKEQENKLNQLLKNIEIKSNAKNEISFEDRINQVIASKKVESTQEDEYIESKELVKINLFQKIINKIKKCFRKNS